jgi:putative sugar O-methyltransferase
MLKRKHFRHPLRTLAAAKEVFTAYLDMAILTARGDARFKQDVRYNLRAVQDGFVPHLSDADDTAILLRICQAYICTGKGELLAKRAYEPTKWWKQVRKTSLGPVRRALASRDLAALHSMYRNFFRDPCSAGLIGVPFKMKQSYSDHPFDDRAGRFFLSDALHRIDHWKEQTGDRFDLRDLAGPDTGNPFGVSLEGTLVRSGTESQHYSAQRVAELLPSSHAAVSEIGGGFGGLAYYLLRDRPRTSYYNFDVSESIALASYYLIKSLPHLKFLLYGEHKPIGEPFADGTVALLPVFELSSVPTKSVDLTFSSHTMSDLARPAMTEYLDQIVRTTSTFFLYVGRSAESNPLEEMIRERYSALRLVDRRILQWNRQKTLNDVEVEFLYQIFST